MTDAYTLKTSYGFNAVETDMIKIMFDWHFNYDESHGVILSKYYAHTRPNWVGEFLVVVKAEVLKFKLVDRRQIVSVPGIGEAQFQKICTQVAIEDYDKPSLALSSHFESIKWVLENFNEFNLKLSENVKYLKSNYPGVFLMLKQNVRIAWQEYE